MGKTVNTIYKANAQAEHWRDRILCWRAWFQLSTWQPNRRQSVENKWHWGESEGFIRKQPALKWDPRKEYTWRLMDHVSEVSEVLN